MDIATFDTKWAEDANGCHLWQATRDANGYGVLRHEGRPMMAHRFSYAVKRGAIPPGIYVCHKCDVPGCVNPEHLFLGSARDNTRDMMAKGRGKHGHIHPPGTHPREQEGAKARTFYLTPEAIRRLNAVRSYTRRASSYLMNQLILEHLPEVPEDEDE